MNYGQILKFATLFMKVAASEKQVLYHIGRRPASPKPYRHAGDPGGLGTEEGWTRWWVDKPVKSAVFLTPNPVVVSAMHGAWGHVYAYAVPEWVIAEAGGIKRFDRGSELLITEELWRKAGSEIEFLGKVMDEEKFYKKVTREFEPGPSFELYHDWEGPDEEEKQKRFAREWRKLQDSSRPLEVIKIMGPEFKQRMLDSINAYLVEKQGKGDPWGINNAMMFKQLLETGEVSKEYEDYREAQRGYHY